MLFVSLILTKGNGEIYLMTFEPAKVPYSEAARFDRPFFDAYWTYTAQRTPRTPNPDARETNLLYSRLYSRIY